MLIDRRLGTEREEALKQQWSECEELERVAVKKACDAQLLTIQEQLQVDKACCADKAVAEAQVCIVLNLMAGPCCLGNIILTPIGYSVHIS